MTFLVVEALWELSSLNSSAAYGQTQSSYAYGEKPPYSEKKFEDTKIIPSVTLAERYDSNVLYVPSGVDNGRTKWDFITSLAPTIEVLNKNRYVETNAKVGAIGSVFVNNPDLNFVSTSLKGSAALDGFINQFIRGAKLQVSDSFSYSPENPSFKEAATLTSTDNPFARGIVPVRADIYQNTVDVKAAYPISSILSLQGNYAYSLLRVGNILVPQQSLDAPAVFFNTDFHTWSVGPNWRLSRSDNISVAFKSTTGNLRGTSGQVADADFTARGAEAGYATRAEDWGVTLSGGATVLEQRVYATGMLTLSAKYGDSTQVAVTGSRQMAPAFFGTVGGALISTTGGISVEHKLDRRLSLSGNANYAYNELAPVKVATFESYTASALLAYRVSRAFTTSLGYSYTHFESNSQGVATQNETGYLVNRHFVTFLITASWN